MVQRLVVHSRALIHHFDFNATLRKARGHFHTGIIHRGIPNRVNGIDQQVLFTGDACNTLQQFETGIGPGFYSHDVEQGQIALNRIIEFKELYPQVTLVFGHDLEIH